MYNSDLSTIFQSNPRYSLPNTYHKPRGWNSCLLGYFNEAKRRSYCLNVNRQITQSNYFQLASINIDLEQSPPQIRKTWQAVCRNLRLAGVIAHWVLEPTRSNRASYHFLTRSQHTEAELRKIIKAAMPNLPHHTHVEPIGQTDQDQRRVINYVLKCKVEGQRQAGGRMYKDVYSNKRLLLAPKLGLQKCGTIGKFWGASPATIWGQVVAGQREIGERLQDENLWGIVDYLEFILEGVPQARIKKAVANNVKVFRRWEDELMGPMEPMEPMESSGFPRQDTIHKPNFVGQPTVHPIRSVGADRIIIADTVGNQLPESSRNTNPMLLGVFHKPIPQAVADVNMPIIPMHKGMYHDCPQNPNRFKGPLPYPCP